MDVTVMKSGNRYRRGCHLSEETRNKISQGKKGIVPWNFGMRGGHHSKEYRRKMSIACGGTGNPKETIVRHHLRRARMISPIVFYLNNKFVGSHLHHMGYGMGIYVPAELHHSLYHSLLKDVNLNEINEIVFNWWRQTWEN
jgi:hypothetical protein